jgi:hypothetical protein
MKGNIMRKVIIGVVCALVAPLAFAQTGITNKQRTTTTETTTTEPVTTTETTYTTGTVSTYEPGKTIVVRDEHEGPVSFALHAPVRIVDRAGHIVKRALTPKDRVKVYYTGTGDTRTVDYVEVED